MYMINHTKGRRGFALLLAIVIAGLVLTIGLALSFLATKEFSVSNTSRDSQIAYYAAQTGANCASKHIQDFADYTSGPLPTIICNGSAVTGLTMDGNGGGSFQFTLSPQNYYTKVSISSATQPDGTNKTVVTAKGYNDPASGKKVERIVTAEGSLNCNFNGDAVLLADASVSITQANYDNIVKKALTDIQNLLHPKSTSANTVSLSIFGTHVKTFAPLQPSTTTPPSYSSLSGLGQATNMPVAMRYAHYELLGKHSSVTSDGYGGVNTTSNYSPARNQPGKDKMVVLLTDGSSHIWFNVGALASPTADKYCNPTDGPSCSVGPSTTVDGYHNGDSTIKGGTTGQLNMALTEINALKNDATLAGPHGKPRIVVLAVKAGGFTECNVADYPDKAGKYTDCGDFLKNYVSSGGNKDNYCLAETVGDIPGCLKQLWGGCSGNLTSDKGATKKTQYTFTYSGGTGHITVSDTDTTYTGTLSFGSTVYPLTGNLDDSAATLDGLGNRNYTTGSAAGAPSFSVSLSLTNISYNSDGSFNGTFNVGGNPQAGKDIPDGTSFLLTPDEP
jgi:Tfp pilus assembly protein PilX